MEETINLIIQKAKKKIQHLDTERILCYTIDFNGKIVSGRTISKDSHKGFTKLDLTKFMNMIDLEKVLSLVVVHNHPRSTMEASDDDDNMTSYIKNFCENYGIELYDHIIIMKDLDCVYSYREMDRIIKKDKNKPSFKVRRKTEAANG